MIGLSRRPHDFLTRRFLSAIRLFADRATSDRHATLVETPDLLETLRHQADTTGPVQVGGDKETARLEARHERRARADFVNVFELELDAVFVGDGERVEDAVRRTAGRGDRGDSVLERAARDDLARRHVAAHEIDASLPISTATSFLAGSVAGTEPLPWRQVPAVQLPSPWCWR